jgi:hypothetical protein
VFLALLGAQVLLRPSATRFVADRRMLYFLAMPVVAAVWTAVLRDANAVFETAHFTTGAVTVVLVVSLTRTMRQFRWLLRCTKAVALLLCAWAMAEHVTGVDGFPTASYSNTNRLSSYLGLLAPVLWAEVFLVPKRAGRKALVSAGVLAASFFVYVVAGARANQLAFLVQVGVVVWQRFQRAPSRLVAWGVRLTFIVFVLLAAEGVVSRVITGESSTGVEQQLTNQYSSAFIRFTMAYDGLRLFLDSYGLGKGAGNVTYADASPLYFGGDESPSSIYPLHNLPMQLLATYGVLGFGLFAYTYVAMWRSIGAASRYARDISRSALPTRPVVDAIHGFMISFPFVALSPSYMFDYRPLYFMFGFLLVADRLTRRRAEAVRVSHVAPRARPPERKAT